MQITHSTSAIWYGSVGGVLLGRVLKMTCGAEDKELLACIRASVIKFLVVLASHGFDTGLNRALRLRKPLER